MRIPMFSAEDSLYETVNSYQASSVDTCENSGITQQCNVWKKIGCASAIAACIAGTAGAGTAACIAATAPSCLDCL